MTLIGTVAVFQEEGRIGDAVTSLFDAGCERVHVLDGAWADTNGTPFGGGPLYSTDRTIEEACDAGAQVGIAEGLTDAGKQTALLHRCSAIPGDVVVRIDADERLSGQLPSIDTHSLLWLRNHGANYLPGVRSTWPRGDDSDHPIPLLRALVYRPDLVCVRPGRWRTDDGWLEPYKVGALAARIDAEGIRYDDPRAAAYRELREREHLLEPAETAEFPIVDGVWIDHYRHAAKAAAKAAYYEVMA